MPVETPEEMTRLLMEARRLAQRIGRYDVWTCPSGAQLWIKSREDLIEDFTPHFAGTSRTRIRLEGNATGVEGLIFASSPEDEFALAFLSPEFENLSLEGGTSVNLQICAFAAQPPTLSANLEEREAQGHFAARFGKTICLPIGILEPDGTPVDPPEPCAIYSGEVVSHRRLTNSLTGRPFTSVQLRTPGGEVDLVCREELSPAPGTLLTCPCYVTGRLAH